VGSSGSGSDSGSSGSSGSSLVLSQTNPGCLGSAFSLVS